MHTKDLFSQFPVDSILLLKTALSQSHGQHGRGILLLTLVNSLASVASPLVVIGNAFLESLYAG